MQPKTCLVFNLSCNLYLKIINKIHFFLQYSLNKVIIHQSFSPFNFNYRLGEELIKVLSNLFSNQAVYSIGFTPGSGCVFYWFYPRLRLCILLVSPPAQAVYFIGFIHSSICVF